MTRNSQLGASHEAHGPKKRAELKLCLNSSTELQYSPLIVYSACDQHFSFPSTPASHNNDDGNYNQDK